MVACSILSNAFGQNSLQKLSDLSYGQNSIHLAKSEINPNTMSTINNVSVGYLTQSSIAFNDTSIWHYIALTKSNSIGNFYLDGNLMYSGNFLSNPYSWNSLLFGATQACVSCQPVPDFNGKIDEVRISNIARSNTSILNYYQSNSAFTADINTLGLFNMDNIKKILHICTTNITTFWYI